MERREREGMLLRIRVLLHSLTSERRLREKSGGVVLAKRCFYCPFVGGKVKIGGELFVCEEA